MDDIHSVLDDTGRILHSYTKLCPPRQHSSHGRQRLVLFAARHGGYADIPHQPTLCDSDVQHPHMDDTSDAGGRRVGVGAEFELARTSLRIGSGIHLYAQLPVSHFPLCKEKEKKKNKGLLFC